MKILASELTMRGSRAAIERRESSETLRAWRGERPDFEAATADRPSAIARISAAARQAMAAAGSAAPPAPSSAGCDTAAAIDAANDAVENDPFLLLVRRMLELLTGEEVRVFDMRAFSADVRQVEARSAAASESVPAAAGRVGWGVEYDYHAAYEESETTAFAAQGTIRTADGREIGFTLELEMSRHYREETNVSLRAGDAVRKDPLVVNFGGTAAQLADQAESRFRFDLDGDGKPETLPLFASGSGYLALDLDGNGRVDSGKELFGPGTGNGFGELARLDEDGNGWIDENDSSFARLSVWTPAAEGAGALRSMADLGIGALGLARVATPFDLRGGGNADLGQIKSSGLYLTESGQAGSLQEIDLTV